MNVKCKNVLFCGFWIIVLVMILGFARAVGDRYMINCTKSVPRGIYRLMPVDEIHKGDLIIFKIPENAEKMVRERRYVAPSVKYMIKRVGAMPGDVVSIRDSILYVNDAPWGVVFDRDSQRYPLPKVSPLEFVIGDGELLPLAEAMKSFDGRYYGKIKQSDVLWKAKFVFGF